jgi:hypothetical protein
VKNLAFPEDLFEETWLLKYIKDLALPEDLFERGIVTTTKVTFQIWEERGIAWGPVRGKVTFKMCEKLGIAWGPVWGKVTFKKYMKNLTLPEDLFEGKWLLKYVKTWHFLRTCLKESDF